MRNLVAWSYFVLIFSSGLYELSPKLLGIAGVVSALCVGAMIGSLFFPSELSKRPLWGDWKVFCSWLLGTVLYFGGRYGPWTEGARLFLEGAGACALLFSAVFVTLVHFEEKAQEEGQ